MYKLINDVVVFVDSDGTIGAGPRVLRVYGEYDSNAASEEVAVLPGEKEVTKQSFRLECDINEIVRRFGVNGVPLPTPDRLPTFGDFTGVSDFQSALHAVMQAEDAFMALPAQVRSRFENDPGAYVAFCSDPANLGELRKMGLAPTPKGPEPMAPVLVKVVPEAPAAPGAPA